MNNIRHGLNGYSMPSYMEEILAHNYCPYFMRMSIVKDGQSYRFSYRPGKYSRINTGDMDIYEKLILLRSIISINDAAEGYLIGAENYLIEPELVYASGKRYTPGNIRILFYPDVKGIRFGHKLIQFTERIKNAGKKEERELLGQFAESIESGGINKGRLFLDKNLLRIEGRSLRNAG